ncbi:Gfo/Idh/MocA family oxidoreductase [Clostridium sartagoforme]|uniref:Gfo/Idh/MocA family oxidoreductase n=1 Tax=Clostridium sartagoforme TaxID=84031 RepID=A0A4S2DMN3_9CLOT|nr:Gfo/Idh/MocA family oxidoreductase [Clostridium sartagoforme]TGY43569.1 Gfo/Idh/MocA family oxidoreductase [Clostridium sartagoforme]
MRYIKVALIGAGSRGRHAYGNYVLNNQDKIRYVAVIEPDVNKRMALAAEHNINSQMCFEDEEDFFNLGKVCDAIIIAHQDKQHYKTAIKALNLAYDVLLEKPITPDAFECMDLEECANRNGVNLMVCHVLRYTEFYEKIKVLLDKKVIGDLIGFDHKENIGHYHMAHSFVRGNWRNSNETSPIILAKTCHDMDIITWLVNDECTAVYSSGNLDYFKKENAPKESAMKCLECNLNEECIFSAKRVYLDKCRNAWPVNTICANPTYENVKEVLDKTNYGNCVWKIEDNDVCDNQVAVMEFKNGVRGTFTVTAFTHNQFRETMLFGTTGSIYANTRDNEIIIRQHGIDEGAESCITVIKPKAIVGGHGGGDVGLMEDFINVVNGSVKEPRTSVKQSIQSHLMSYACEKSRLEKRRVEIETFKKEIKEGRV